MYADERCPRLYVLKQNLQPEPGNDLSSDHQSEKELVQLR